MFNYGMIDDVYDIMYEEALLAEKKYMTKVKNILKRKATKSTIDDELLNTNDREKFFELLLHGYNNTQASATVNVAAGTYTVNINGNSTVYTVSGADKTKINECIKKKKINQAAGYLFELAAKPILNHMLDQWTSNLSNTKTEGKNVVHRDNYYRDYEVEYHYSEPPDPRASGGVLFPIEVKAKLDDFHVANAKKKGVLNILDYTKYYNQDQEQDGYDVYEYIKMKLVREKLENNYPVFYSVNHAQLGVLLSSTMLSKSYNFYLENEKIPSDAQILAMARQIVSEESGLAQTDLSMYSPYVNAILSSLRQNDSDMQEFTQTILKRVIKNAKNKSGIAGFSLWYGRRFSGGKRYDI